MKAKGEPVEYVLARIFPLHSAGARERVPPGGRMPHRQFTDSKRTRWEVWEVEPSHAEPIPTGWEALDASALEQLCEQANSVGRPRRLLE